MARRIDPAKLKAKRDKVIAGVLGGVLLVIMIFSVPMAMKQWKQLNGGGQETQPTAAATPVTPPPPTPALGTPATPAGGIADTASAPLGTSELHAFDLFESKDPFEQQVDDVAAASPPPASTGATPPPAGGGTFTPDPSAPTAKPPAPAPTSAVVTVNGAPGELVTVGVDFPLPPAEPLFHVVSIAPGKIRISIAGGSLSDGSAAVTLLKGKTLTLENTADGTRYELRLLWTGTGAPPPGLVPEPASSTTTTTATTTATP